MGHFAHIYSENKDILKIKISCLCNNHPRRRILFAQQLYSVILKVEVFDLMDLSESYLLHVFHPRVLKGMPGRHLQVVKHTENTVVSDQSTSVTTEHGMSSPQVQTEFNLLILLDQCLLFCY